MRSGNLGIRLLTATLAATALSALPGYVAPDATAADIPRPTEDVYTAPEATPVCREDICVHYAQDGTNDVPTEDDGPGGAWKGTAGNGVPDYVDLLSGSILPKVAAALAQGGFRPPADDFSEGGGQDLVDFYLADLADVEGGAYCRIDDRNQSLEQAGFCVLDNDYSAAEYGTRLAPSDQLALDAAAQYSYLTSWADSATEGWLDDATALWAEGQLYPALHRNYAYLPYGPLRHPTATLGGPRRQADEPRAAGAAWLFIQFLGERYPNGEGGIPVFIGDLWASQNNTHEYDGLTLIDNLLRYDHRSSLVNEVAYFARWNRDPARYYDNGRSYPRAPLQGSAALSGSRPSRTFSGALAPLSSQTFRFRPAAGLTGHWNLRLRPVVRNVEGYADAAMIVTFKAKGRAPVTRLLNRNDGPPLDKTVTLAFTSSVEWVEISVAAGAATDLSSDTDGTPASARYAVIARVIRG